MTDQKSKDMEKYAQRLLIHLTDSWKAQAIHVASALHIPDLLSEKPQTCMDLAISTQSHSPSLCRLLKALVTLEICQEQEDGTFILTPLGNHLRSDIEPSLHAWSIWWGKYLWPVWGNLLYSVQTGESARTLLWGTKGFEHLEKDPDAAEIFNRGLAELTQLTASHITQAYDFSSITTLVDVGGGYGKLLSTILKANPHMTGILFDLGHAMDGAKQLFAAKGLEQRCEFHPGDFFSIESFPRNADAYIFKSIIHDWNDEDSRNILINCRKAMNKNGCILLIDHVIPDKLEANPIHQSIMRNDLNMLAALAAQERTETEFRQLLHSSGFNLNKILPVDVTFSLIEATPFQTHHQE